MKVLKQAALFVVLSLFSVATWAACSYNNTTELKSLTAGFEAWKAVTSAMAECGNFSPELDQEFREKQPSAFAAKPSLYQIGGVANGTLVPLVNDGLIRGLDGLVAEYGAQLKPNQLIRINGETVAIAMMVNAQHLMYREDILADLGIPEPTNYDEVLAAAKVIKEAGVVDYPLGGTFKTGWNLGEEFINMYIGYGGAFFDGNEPSLSNPAGVDTLNMLKALSEYMDPEFLVSDSTYVQQQFQQGKIAMANLWASRAAAMDDPNESKVVGKVVMAKAPSAVPGGIPASTLWWDGIVLAKNMSDSEAEAAFRVALEGIDSEMVQANNDVAVWLIDGFQPGPLARGAIATAEARARPYPASTAMGIMHTVLGDGVSDFLTGSKTAVKTLRDIENAYRVSAKEKGLL